MAPGKISCELTGSPSLNKVFELIWIYGVTLLAPAITTQQSTQHGRQNKKAYRFNNYQ